jgi:hypothetical protein
MNKRDNIIKWSVISIFVLLYLGVSVISTIHVIDFFKLSNPDWLATTLAIAFEVGAAASLAAIIILDKTSRGLVWALFATITLMQMMGNMYYAYTHLTEYQNWSELFGLIEEEPIYQKRVLSIVSGAILPLVALGFIKSLVDYIRPTTVEGIKNEFEKPHQIEEEISRKESLQITEEPQLEAGPIIEVREEIPLPVEEPTDEIQLNAINHEVEAIKNDETLTSNEKVRRIEEKIAKVIAKNPEIKKQIEEKIREIEDGDKYTKTDTSSNETQTVQNNEGTPQPVPVESRRITSGM